MTRFLVVFASLIHTQAARVDEKRKEVIRSGDVSPKGGEVKMVPYCWNASSCACDFGYGDGFGCGYHKKWTDYTANWCWASCSDQVYEEKHWCECLDKEPTHELKPVPACIDAPNCGCDVGSGAGYGCGFHKKWSNYTTDWCWANCSDEVYEGQHWCDCSVQGVGMPTAPTPIPPVPDSSPAEPTHATDLPHLDVNLVPQVKLVPHCRHAPKCGCDLGSGDGYACGFHQKWSNYTTDWCWANCSDLVYEGRNWCDCDEEEKEVKLVPRCSNVSKCGCDLGEGPGYGCGFHKKWSDYSSDWCWADCSPHEYEGQNWCDCQDQPHFLNAIDDALIPRVEEVDRKLENLETKMDLLSHVK